MIIGIGHKAQVGKDLTGRIIQYLIANHRLKNTNELPIELSSMSEIPFHVWDKENYNNEFYSGWQIKKYATKLKEVCSLLTGIPVEDFEKEEVKSSILAEEWWKYDFSGEPIPYLPYISNAKEWVNVLIKPSIRQLLQKVGTDAMRDVIHPDVWVNALMKDFEKPAVKAIRETGGYCNHPNPVEFPNWIITDVRFPNEAKAIKDREGIVIKVHRWHNREGKVEHESETALDRYQFDYVLQNTETIEDLIAETKTMLVHFNLI